MYKVMGYSDKETPANGVHMSESTDEDFAHQICEACARTWMGQWFGVVAPDGTVEPPFRYTKQVWELRNRIDELTAELRANLDERKPAIERCGIAPRRG